MSAVPDVAGVLAHSAWVRSLARELVSDRAAAEDLAQQALLTAFDRPPERGNLRAWLQAVVRNLAAEWRRREAQRTAVERRGARGEALPSPDELLERAESARALVERVLALAEPHRTILLLRHFEGLRPAEIARRERLPLATVKSRLARAHERLRADLEREGADWRGAWLALAGAERAGAPSLTGVLVLSTAAKLAAGLLAVAVLAWGVWRWSGSAPPSPPGASPELAGAPGAPAAVDEHQAAPAQSGAEPAESRAPATAPAAVAAPASKPRCAAGVVVRPDGQPAGGALVLLGTLLEYGPPGTGAPDDRRKSTTCDAEGRFELADLEPGRVVLVARADGYAASAPLPFVLEEQGRAGLRLTLRAGATLRCQVLRPDGQAAPGRAVRVMAPELGQLTTHKTDEQGRFEAAALTPARWTLSTLPDEKELLGIGIEPRASLGGLTYMAQQRIELADGAVVDVLLGQPLASPLRVHGTLTQRGAPVSGLLQWFGAEADTLRAQHVARVADDGRYEIQLPAAGWYLVCGSAPLGRFEQRVEVREGGPARIDFAAPAAELRGVVRDEQGAPLAGITVQLTREQGDAFRQPVSLPDRVTTKEDGRFAFSGLAPGTWAVAALDSGGASEQHAAQRASGLVLASADEVRELELRLALGRAREVRVFDEHGRLAAHASVFVFDASGRCLTPISMLLTDREGRTLTPPVRGEGSLFAVRHEQCSRAVAFAAGDELAQEPIRLELGRAARLVLERPATETGRLPRLFDERGRVLSGLRDGRNPWTDLAGGTDASVWRFGPLPPGPLRVDWGDDHAGEPLRAELRAGEETRLRWP